MEVPTTYSTTEAPDAILSPHKPITPALERTQTDLSYVPSATSTVVSNPDEKSYEFDIEHTPVYNDPRAWTSLRKVSGIPGLMARGCD